MSCERAFTDLSKPRMAAPWRVLDRVVNDVLMALVGLAVEVIYDRAIT